MVGDVGCLMHLECNVQNDRSGCDRASVTTKGEASCLNWFDTMGHGPGLTPEFPWCPCCHHVIGLGLVLGPHVE